MPKKLRYIYGQITVRRTIIILICLATLILLRVCTSEETQTVTIDIQNNKNSITGKISSRPVYGVNTNFFRSPENLDDPSFLKLFGELQMPLLRFPGGLANWYNWQQGTIETTGRKILNFMKEGGFREITLNAIIDVAQRFKIQLLYVVNVYDSEEKIKGLITRLLSSGIDIRGIEIGNEVYTKLFSDEIGGPSGYLIKARRALKALRNNGYHGPVGVNLAPAWMPGQEKHVHKRHWLSWNLALQKDGLGGFDAVIVHYYPFVKKIGFSEAVKRGPLEFKEMVADIRKRFPDKQIWMTEWNLGQPVSIREFNSLHHAIFNMKMFAAFLETGIELTCYHVLAGRGWELLGPDRFTLNYRDSQEATILRRIPYFAFKLFSESYKDATKYQIGKIGNLEYIVLSTTGKLSIIGWTIKKQQLHLQLEQAENYIFINGVELQGNNLLCSNGNLNHWREDKDILPWKENCKLKTLDRPKFTGPGIFKFDYSTLLLVDN